MVSTEADRRGPYVGPLPFERSDAHLFFGREKEARELRSLILAHREVLLYAQSGAGKTSLLNARLLPLLEQRGADVLPRAHLREPIPDAVDPEDIRNIYAFSVLMRWAGPGVDPRELTETSLVDFLRQRQRSSGGGPPKPRVAVIDQFEELFTSYPDRWREREALLREVAEALEADPLLRVVFVMREDAIAHMDRYATLLPDRLRARYRLERLREPAALAAVTGPLEGTGRSFEPGVAEALVTELLSAQVETVTGGHDKVKGEFVEPVHLQIVCQRLWQELPADVTKITELHREAFANVDEVLAGLYEDAVARAAAAARISAGRLRRWVDHKLITSSGTRGTAFRGQTETEGIPNAAVDVLEAARVIRPERRREGPWYELTHDRFVEPIRESNRRQQERSLRRLGWLVGVPLLVLFLGLAACGTVKYNAALTETRAAELGQEEWQERASKAEGRASKAEGWATETGRDLDGTLGTAAKAAEELKKAQEPSADDGARKAAIEAAYDALEDLAADARAQSEVERAYYRWVDAWSAMDLDSFMGFYADDCRVERDKGTYGRDAFMTGTRRRWRVVESITLETIGEPLLRTLEDREIELRVTQRFLQRYKPGAVPGRSSYEDYGVKTLRWDKRGGEWKVVHESFDTEWIKRR